jgi:pyruvate/2-oxoacid:ferredoxin oxidoreductase alpha subunit
VAEDPRVLLPVMVCMDGFILSHTSMEIELAEQDQVDRFLPRCDVPHHLDNTHPFTTAGMTMPDETLAHRVDLAEAMAQVPGAFEEHRARFHDVFGREVAGAVTGYRAEDADHLFITSSTISTTVRDVVDERRARGERVGMIRIKMFHPFPADDIRRLCAGASRVGVLDRNYAAGSGGIFWKEVSMALQPRGDLLVQGYLTGVGGVDVLPGTVHEVMDDLAARETAGDAVWTGVKR